MSALRVLAFGGSVGEPWGVSLSSGEANHMLLATRAGAATAVFEVALFEPAEGGWQLEGDGVRLAFQPAAALLRSQDPEQQLERDDQLCQVGGDLRLDGQDKSVECLGWSSSARGVPELRELGSARFLAGWLDRQAGFSLTALRPRKARGHEEDLVAAALIDEPPPQVVDPRFSTTYDEQGKPVRAGLELWLESEPSENTAAEEPPQYQRRALAEATGPGLDWEHEALTLHASLLRWQTRGAEGPGVYVLGRAG